MLMDLADSAELFHTATGIAPIAVARELWDHTRRAEGHETAAPGNELSRPVEQDRVLPPAGGDGTPA